MQKVDYIIVGYGVAAVCFAGLCLSRQKSFVIFDDGEKAASHIAAGMFNPIILYRFTSVFKGWEQMKSLQTAFSRLENLVQTKVIYKIPVYRILADAEEAKIWEKKAVQDAILNEFLNPVVIENNFKNIKADYGFGEVYNTGRIDFSQLLFQFSQKFQSFFRNEKFIFSELDLKNNSYQNIKFNHLIFAEGIKVENNPYFNFIPIIKNKGETLIIESDAELPEIAFKSKSFLMPLGNKKYYVGSTYDKKFNSPEITTENRISLENNLQSFFKGNYKVVSHQAGLRPTTGDRRGIIGQHPKFDALHVLNGLGTHGAMNAAYLAEMLFNKIEDNQSILPEFDVKRWYASYFKRNKK
ncbi:MAG: FAD-dependent oxidoreductase [Flavobacteriaceae bacterium]|nr:FAD-dependent oxidoreductase [Flavobacteriaceae bacterium]